MKDHEELKARVEYKDGVLHMKHYTGAVLDKNDMERILEFQKQMTGDATYCLLLDMRGHVTVTEAAARLSANNPNHAQIKAAAVITQRGITHTGANLYSKVGKPNINTRVFLTEED